MLLNRELSWLDFNQRVLYEMNDPIVDLHEKMKFSAIFSSNLDEFYMVRVAAIKNQIASGYNKPDPSGLSPLEVLEKINEKVRRLIKTQDNLTTARLAELEGHGFKIIRSTDYTEKVFEELERKFEDEIFPVLTPMGVDFSRPFPLISNKAIYIAVKLERSDETQLALIQVPSVLGRLIKLKDGSYAMLEDVIMLFCNRCFIGYDLKAACRFRITRNGDLDIIEEEIEDLLMVIEEAVKLRKWGETMRLEIESGCDQWLYDTIVSSVNIDKDSIFNIDVFFDYTFLFGLPISNKKKAFKPHKPVGFDRKSVFKSIKENDIFLHHPYESFTPVINFIKDAVKDPQVLAIKQTLYRVSGNSPIIKALSDAAEAGKQVTVLVELRARFDEENNINWAKRLEKKGAHVIYGLYGLKTHSKITMVVRNEKGKIRRYLHLSTGNYNDQTSKTYTDMAYMTRRESFGEDATTFFNLISGFMDKLPTSTLIAAPYRLRSKFESLIEREIENVKAGRAAKIIAKFNSLVDPEMIRELYRASDAGVKVHLIVRGICVLIPQVKGMSENITVRSIIGEFLEHSRIFYFKNGGASEVYLSSADWMPRNLNRRVELMFPIVDELIAKRIKMTLELYLADDTKAWEMGCDGVYSKLEGRKIFAHEILKNIEYDSNQEFIDKIKKIL